MTGGERYTDDEYVQGLKEIDESEEISVTEWEGNFLNSIKKMPKPRVLSPKQRETAENMIVEYLGEDWEP